MNFLSSHSLPNLHIKITTFDLLRFLDMVGGDLIQLTGEVFTSIAQSKSAAIGNEMG